jgi:two-component system, HptB-dependent secretion and biofilm response regulator
MREGAAVSNTPSNPITILIADDSPTDRLILQTMLQRLGYKLILAEDGQQALDKFISEKPEFVFLDVLMPNMDGVEAAAKIKEAAGDDFIPVIFLTSLADAPSLARCLDAGGDDFLSKPYNHIVIEAKIKAFSRMRVMNKTLSLQKDLIEKNNQHLIQEQNVAKQVFDKIAHAGSLKLPIIRYYMSALAVFNGDVLLADVSPTGSLMVLLGDFTGHGLPAAIGSMPLASIFYGMVNKGFGMAEILREINNKLNKTLPMGLFCCATFLDINFRKKRVLVWSGGLPDGAIYRAESKTVERIKSKNLPLAILSNQSFKAEPERFSISPGDHILLWSDGIQEARNSNGIMFGEDNLNAILDQQLQAEQVFDDIIQKVQKHIGEGERDDDVSLVDITFPDEELAAVVEKKGSKGRGCLQDWALTFRLEASSLRVFDPMPLLLHITSEVPGLRQSNSVLFTVLSELFNNAVEHGVLGLQSSIKQSPSGFAEYYRQRKEGLENLPRGAYVILEFVHQVEHNGGLLTIRVRDSGAGFSPENTAATPGGKPDYHGRGLTLLRTMCETIIITPPGNCVEAQFRWVAED